MRPPRFTRVLAPIILAALAACTPAVNSSQPPASVPASVPASAPASVAASATPAFTTGPTGKPIGTWSLTLVGGPAAGDYHGTDEMICTGIAGGPRAVVFQPVGNPPIQHVAADTFGADSSILISAGGIESGAVYGATTGQPFATVVLGEATITDGVLTFSISGTELFAGQEPREMSLTATCPLFPAETDG